MSDEETKMNREIENLSDLIGEMLRKHLTEIAEQYGVDYETVATIYDEYAGVRQA